MIMQFSFTMLIKRLILISVVSVFLVTAAFSLYDTANGQARPEAPSDVNLDTDKPVGGLRHTDWTDMLPHTKSGSYYNEFWTYNVFLEDDLHLHITFSLANFGSFKSAVSGGRLFVSNFDGENYNVAREFDLDYFHIDEEKHKIRLHTGREIFLEGKLPDHHRIYFKTEKNGVSYHVDLEFEDIHPGYTWGDGIFKLGDDDMGVFIHIPKASVRGTVAINEHSKSVKGTAYMDHTFQTDLSSKVVDKGFRHISHENNGFEVGYYLIPKKKYRSAVVGFGLSNNGSPIRLEKPERLNILSSERLGGKSVPESYEVFFKSGNSHTFERQKHFQHVSFLEEVGGFRKRLVRGFLGGEIIEYVGLGNIDGNVPVNYNILMVH